MLTVVPDSEMSLLLSAIVMTLSVDTASIEIIGCAAKTAKFATDWLNTAELSFARTITWLVPSASACKSALGTSTVHDVSTSVAVYS